MEYTGYMLAFLYLTYSFLGWVAETVVATVNGRSFANRGFASGPFCFIYGFAAVVLTIALTELRDNLFFLFMGSMLMATAIEWITAKLLERIHSSKWWDYSGKRWNFDGYICLQYSLLWGLLGSLAVLFGNGLLLRLFALLPALLGKILVWSVGVIEVLDQLASLLAVLQMDKPGSRLSRLNAELEKGTLRLGGRIAASVNKRLQRAYPAIRRELTAEQVTSLRKANRNSLAELVWLFTLGSLAGDIVETIFCRVTAGVWMSRSSLVWGPFSVVWGMALVLAAVMLRQDESKPDRHIFLVGALMGGAYEYLCSALGELVFGVVFWDYSEMPFNLGGRINLLYCLFWGVAAVVWIRCGYPLLARFIRWVRQRTGKALTLALAVFMVVNMAVSALALIRYDARVNGLPPANGVERLLDERFGNERMERIYPNAVQR